MSTTTLHGLITFPILIEDSKTGIFLVSFCSTGALLTCGIMDLSDVQRLFLCFQPIVYLNGSDSIRKHPFFKKHAYHPLGYPSKFIGEVDIVKQIQAMFHNSDKCSTNSYLESATLSHQSLITMIPDKGGLYAVDDKLRCMRVTDENLKFFNEHDCAVVGKLIPKMLDRGKSFQAPHPECFLATNTRQRLANMAPLSVNPKISQDFKQIASYIPKNVLQRMATNLHLYCDKFFQFKWEVAVKGNVFIMGEHREQIPKTPTTDLPWRLIKTLLESISIQQNIKIDIQKVKDLCELTSEGDLKIPESLVEATKNKYFYKNPQQQKSTISQIQDFLSEGPLFSSEIRRKLIENCPIDISEISNTHVESILKSRPTLFFKNDEGSWESWKDTEIYKEQEKEKKEEEFAMEVVGESEDMGAETEDEESLSQSFVDNVSEMAIEPSAPKIGSEAITNDEDKEKRTLKAKILLLLSNSPKISAKEIRRKIDPKLRTQAVNQLLYKDPILSTKVKSELNSLGVPVWSLKEPIMKI